MRDMKEKRRSKWVWASGGGGNKEHWTQEGVGTFETEPSGEWLWVGNFQSK